MSRLHHERAFQVRACVEAASTKAFGEFALTHDAELGSFLCRHPIWPSHHFRLLFQPGLVLMWGDLGEFVLRVSDDDAKEWYLSQGAEPGDYPDYFCGKIRAASSPHMEFYIGEARAYIRERIEEHAHDNVWREVGREFERHLREDDHAAETCWALACREAGVADPPPCTWWTGAALWAWYACRTFARLSATRSDHG